MRADTRFGGNVGERSVAIVQEELVGERFVELGMTVFRLTVRLAVRLSVDVPTHVIHDKKIEKAVVVYIDPSSANGPQRAIFLVGLREAGCFGDVGERAVAIVVVERVAVDAGDKDVFVPVVIVIADGDTDIVSGSSEASLFGDVGKRAISVVAEEPVPIFGRRLLQSDDVRPIGEKNVEVAVMVVVENSDASGHGFRCVLFVRF